MRKTKISYYFLFKNFCFGFQKDEKMNFYNTQNGKRLNIKEK